MAEYPWASATIPYLDKIYARMNDNDKTRRGNLQRGMDWMKDQDTDADKTLMQMVTCISGPGHIRHARIWGGRMAAGYCAAMVLYGA